VSYEIIVMEELGFYTNRITGPTIDAIIASLPDLESIVGLY